MNKLYICLLFLLAGCSTFESLSYQMGPSLNDNELSQISLGTSRQEIIDRYGPPPIKCIRPEGHNICYFHQKRHRDTVKEQRYVEFLFSQDEKLEKIVVHE